MEASHNPIENWLKKLQKSIPDLDETLAKLDKVCSVIFSFTFLVICMTLSLFVVLLFFGLMGYLLSLTLKMEPSTIKSILRYSLLVLTLLFFLGSLIYLIDTLSLGFFKKYKWLSKVYYPVYLFFGFITMAGFYRAIYYHLTSHFPKRRIQLFLLAYAIIPILTPFHRVDYYLFFPDNVSAETLSALIYDDNRDDDSWIEKASIPSRFISDSFLPLFIRYDVKDNEDILKWCDDYTPAKSSGFVSGIHIGKDGFGFTNPKVEEPDPAKLKDCLTRFYEIYINDSLYNQQRFYYYIHPNKGEPGLYTVFDIQHLERGQQNITIKTKIIDDAGKLKKEDYITFPFWFDKRSK